MSLPHIIWHVHLRTAGRATIGRKRRKKKGKKESKRKVKEKKKKRESQKGFFKLLSLLTIDR